jgi:dienelactone hydrolase
MKRTGFFGAAVATTAATVSAMTPALAELPHMRRFEEQRWALDDLIQTIGMDWDQGRSAGLISSLGPESQNDINALRARIKKFADFEPAFEAAARRREGMAKDEEAAGHRVSARDSYFMAANFYAQAQWSIYEKNEKNLALNAKKRECFERYARLADRKVEFVWVTIPGGKKLPGVFHLPPSYTPGTKIPAIVAIPGMDGNKERTVALYGDRWMNRGVAVLALEAPGEWEAPLLDIFVRMPDTAATGTAAYDWLAARPEIDPQQIGITGSSFGTLFAVAMLGKEHRFKGCAIQSTVFEPGCHTIFEEASPTFKRRFMFMAGYTDESAFNEFAKTLTWLGSAEKITTPILCMGGEADELSPSANVEKMFSVIPAPKRLVIYADSRHSLGGVPSTTQGPNPGILAADWMLERFAGKPMKSEHWFVEPSGHLDVTPYA